MDWLKIMEPSARLANKWHNEGGEGRERERGWPIFFCLSLRGAGRTLFEATYFFCPIAQKKKKKNEGGVKESWAICSPRPHCLLSSVEA